MNVAIEGRRAAANSVARLSAWPNGIARGALNFAQTVRGKIFLAFGLMAAITCLLGLAGMNSVRGTGDVVVASFAKPLASISYARFALARFTEMQTLMARQLAFGPMRPPNELGERLNVLVRETGTYLRLAVSPATSPRAAAMAKQAADNVARWDAERRLLGSRVATGNDRAELARLGNLVLDDFEQLVVLTAEDGLSARQHALSAIADFRRLTLIATLFALFFGAVVAFLLARLTTRPIAVASRAAERIASGELDVPIEDAGRADEFGTLLVAMATMRDNIRVMMQREVAARHAAQHDLAAAIESAPAAMILVNGDNRISVANSQAMDFFPEHADALATGELFSRRLAAAFAEPADEVRLADGRWIKLNRRMTEDGGFVAVAADITALKDRERALVAARDIAEAANRAKTDFLANMSHELRTPLNAVIGFSEMISAEILGPVGQPKYKEFADDILFSGRHLLEIINHVLDIAKLQWGKMEIDHDPTELGEVVAEAVRIARAQAQAGVVALAMESDAAVPPISGDRTRLRQIVLNLLSNAIKFTPEGGRVDVTLRRRGDFVEIAVRDNGIGMNPSDIPKALEPFQQIESSMARKYRGTGLGLPLCKLFVELHGGGFAIASALGEGTTVTVTLPIPVNAEPAPVLAAAE